MSPDDIDVQILETEILLDQTHAEVWFDRIISKEFSWLYSIAVLLIFYAHM